MALLCKRDIAFKAVNSSNEFKRILDMPRRDLADLLEDQMLVDKWNGLTKRPGATMSLWPIQAAALEEAYLQDGAFCPIGVGAGKTLISLLLPTAMRSKKAVILVPPKLYDKTLREVKHYSIHFHIRVDILKVIKYSFLSSQKGLNALEHVEPDLIVADEAHCLKDPKAARTNRFLNYMKKNPHCRFVGLSGTMMSKSILDFAHLSELALRKNSPMPLYYNERIDWAGALDASPREFVRAGALKLLCEEGENVRGGFQRRMVSTKGVITTTEAATGVPLIMTRINAPFDSEQKEQIKKLRKTWEIGDEVLEDPMRVAAFHSQLASGFYYIWDWPNGEDKEWNEARLAWAKEVRGFLKRTRDRNLDTKGLVENAVREGRLPELGVAWAVWEEQMHKPEPPTKPISVSPYVRDCVRKWERRVKTGIIWYKHRATAETLAQYGYDVYTPDRDPEGAEGVIVCSIKAHGTGKNLQFTQKNNLLLNIPPSGDIMEQLIGRTHRPGQSSTVNIDWLGNTFNDESLDKATLLAQAMQQSMGQPQKLLYSEKRLDRDF